MATENTKTFYKISEVAEMLNVNASLIRYYEKEFKQIKPIKNRKGDRLFNNESIETLKKIYNLIKDKGLTIEGAKEYLKNELNPSKNKEIVSKLLELKLFLQAAKEQLNEK